MDKLTEVFCLIDDFCQEFEPEWEKRLLSLIVEWQQEASPSRLFVFIGADDPGSVISSVALSSVQELLSFLCTVFFACTIPPLAKLSAHHRIDATLYRAVKCAV